MRRREAMTRGRWWSALALGAVLGCSSSAVPSSAAVHPAPGSARVVSARLPPAEVSTLPTAPPSPTVGGPPAGLQYYPLTPARLLDTRSGVGGISAPIGPGGGAAVQVAGLAGVPAAGAAAVVVNVTVVDTTAASWLSVYPDGRAFPGTSTVNWVPGEIRANLAIVPLGPDGALRLLNLTGSTDVVIDVEGYFATPQAGDTSGLYRPLTPARLLDTRSGFGGLTALGPQQTATFQVTGRGNVPATGVSAVILNVTATDSTAATYLSAFPAGAPLPGTSTVNPGPGQTVPNRVVVKLGTGGRVSLFNGSGQVDVVVDVAAWFTDGSDPAASGGSFTPVAPARVLDTRTGPPGTIPPNVMEAFRVGGLDGLLASGISGVALNVTETDPTGTGWLAVFPDGNWLPLASDLNFVPGETHANATVVKVGADGRLLLDTPVGTVDVVADVSGWFSSAPVPGPPPSAPAFTQAVASSPFSVELSWTPPSSSGGSELVNYTISSSPDDGLWAVDPSAAGIEIGGLRCGVSYTFWIAASNGAGTGPPSAPIGVTTSCTHTIGNVTYYRQVYELSCEEAALQMALSHEGIYPSQAQELNDMGIDYRAGYYSAGVLQWGDPYGIFVGDPNGSEVALTGYGTYYPTIAGLAARYGGRVLRAGEGIPAQDV